MIREPDVAGITACIAALEAGEVIAIPTDTVYGLVARLDRPAAVDRLFLLKKRERDLALPVLCPSSDVAAGLGRLEGPAAELAAEHWPGPLTLILGRMEGVSVDLGGDPETIGVRVPADSDALAVLDLTGPLASTSANLHGAPAATTAPGVEVAFGEEIAEILAGSTSGSGRSSTVVLCDAGGRPIEVLRQGDIAEIWHV